MDYSKISFRKRKDYIDIVIYYANTTAKNFNGKKELIIPTGIKTLKRFITKSKTLSTAHPDYETVSYDISKQKARVEELIKDYIKEHGEKPECEWLEQELEKPVIQQKKQREYILDYYPDFLEHVKKMTKDSSIGKYNSLKDALEQFIKKKRKGNGIRFVDIDENFISDFIEFLCYEKVDERQIKVVKTGLNNNVVITRIKDLKRFFKYCITKEKIKIDILEIEEWIKGCKVKNSVKAYKPTKFALTLDEIQYYYNFTPSEYEREKDIFLFMCLQGTRISDTLSLHDLDIQNGKIERDAIKTEEEFNVELHPMSLEIWEKWDNNFSMYDTDFNERIKVVFKEFFIWYKPQYEKRFKKPYEITIVKNVKKGTEIKRARLNKWDLVSSHLGRHTFISLWSSQPDKVSLPEVMQRTGQKDLKVALGYTHPVREVKAEEIIPLTKLKL